MGANLEANMLKGKIEKISGIDKTFTIEVLEQMDIAPFEVSFNEPEELILDSTGKNYYMSADTYGDNWRVSKETTANMVTGPDKTGHMRMFYSENKKYMFFRAMSTGKKYVFDFTAPYSAYYKMSANVHMDDPGGYVDIYLNDVLVGSKIDTYSTTESLVNIKLGTHKLKVGRYANKIKIVPNGISGGTKCRPSFVGFRFEIV